MDVRGMEFDRTGLFGHRLIAADSQVGDESDEVSALYALHLAPELAWFPITEVVSIDTRFYWDIAIGNGGSFGANIYVTEEVSESLIEVDPNGTPTPFATGFNGIRSVTIGAGGDKVFVSDSMGVYRIRPANLIPGPTIVMREPWVKADDVHTGPSGVDWLRLLWSERVLFDNEDVSITNEDAEPVSFSVSGSNSQFMIIAFGEVLLNDEYTITISDSVVSAETGAAIDGDDDGLAGGDAILEMEHRSPFDHDRDGDVDLPDFAAFQAAFTGPLP